jgi:hypothetical protein
VVGAAAAGVLAPGLTGGLGRHTDEVQLIFRNDAGTKVVDHPPP